MLYVACKCLNIRAIINSALEDNNNVFEDASIGLLSGEIKAFFKDVRAVHVLHPPYGLHGFPIFLPVHRPIHEP